MRQIEIEIDHEVFAYLQDHALAFVDTPNLTLRRLFQLDKSDETPIEIKPTNRKVRKKQPKTDLRRLIDCGLIEEGRKVFLVDYQGKKIHHHSATINGARLRWQGMDYSMSLLAKNLLQDEGYESESVRGPAHWCTDDNVTIKKLWQRHLSNLTSQSVS